MEDGELRITLTASEPEDWTEQSVYDAAFEMCQTFDDAGFAQLTCGSTERGQVEEAIVDMFDPIFERSVRAGCAAGFEARPSESQAS